MAMGVPGHRPGRPAGRGHGRGRRARDAGWHARPARLARRALLHRRAGPVHLRHAAGARNRLAQSRRTGLAAGICRAGRGLRARRAPHRQPAAGAGPVPQRPLRRRAGAGRLARLSFHRADRHAAGTLHRHGRLRRAGGRPAHDRPGRAAAGRALPGRAADALVQPRPAVGGGPAGRGRRPAHAGRRPGARRRPAPAHGPDRRRHRPALGPDGCAGGQRGGQGQGRHGHRHLQHGAGVGRRRGHRGAERCWPS